MTFYVALDCKRAVLTKSEICNKKAVKYLKIFSSSASSTRIKEEIRIIGTY